MYYSDHLAFSKMEITSSKFCTLVDVAILLYEEESRNRIFHLFPRKTRSSLVTSKRRRRNPQHLHGNFNGPSSSSSSSHLLDLQLLSSSYSSSLGDYYTEMTNPPNPNSRSSSSSCLTEMTNPNSLKTEKTRLKKRVGQEVKRSGKAKKAKVAPLGKETPERLVQLMTDMNGAEPRLIFEKTLSQTDCDPAQSRLLMPFNSLIRNDFLTPVESRIVEKQDTNNDENIGVGSIIVDQRGVKWGVIFKRRDMKKKDSGKVNLNYALICGWSDMVKANILKDGDSISVWSFRLR